MIFAIREGVRTYLRDHLFPVDVTIGATNTDAHGAARFRHRVVLDRDRQGGDTLREPIGSKGNPRRVMTRMVGYTATIYALAPTPGALPWEHENEVDKIADAVLIALRDWVVTEGAAVLEITSARMLTPDEMQGSQTAPSAGYQMQFKIGRSVDRRDYDGAGETETIIEDVVTTAEEI